MSEVVRDGAEDGAAVTFLDLPAQQRRIGDALRRRLGRVLDHCRFVLGPEVDELEGRLASLCGAAHCVTVSSGTDALQIAMMAEGIGPGDAVFLPAFTYTATAEVPLLLGAMPVFIDIDPGTFQIDPDHLADRVREVRNAGLLRPRAIVGVDLFGQPAPWVELRTVAAAHGLFLLDDCAQSLGASFHGRPLGREADATATSFFPSKPLGAYGDGGALFTEDGARAALYRSLRSHGEGDTRYDVERIGVNGRLDTLQAAVLLAKLDVFAEERERRREIASRYDRGLDGIVTVPGRVPRSEGAWPIYAVLLPDRAARDALRAALAEAAIPTAIYYPTPLHLQPAYASSHDGTALPVSVDVADRVLSLPIHADLADAAVERVVETVRRLRATG